MLIDVSTFSPPYVVNQNIAAEELKKRMAVRPAVGRLIDSAAVHSGIDTRHIVIPDAEEGNGEKFYSSGGSYYNPDTKLRMLNYEKWSKVLTEGAADDLFSRNSIDPAEIDRLITISCTGFYAPGVDYHLIKRFNLPSSIKRTHIGFMGCAASLIGFNSVLEMASTNNDFTALVVSVEICSIHLQTEPSRDNILANIIFADGAAAALFSSRHTPKVELTSTASALFENSSEFMGWKIGNTGFEMLLSSELPRIILNEAVPKLKEILKGFDLDVENIKHWALHPGGRAILDSLQEGLKLSSEQMHASREVLREYGNMSSASILFVIKKLLDGGSIKKGEYCCAVAFGPGLTMEVAIMKGH